MKKAITPLLFVFLTLVFSSCVDSNIQNDAKSLAEISSKLDTEGHKVSVLEKSNLEKTDSADTNMELKKNALEILKKYEADGEKLAILEAEIRSWSYDQVKKKLIKQDLKSTIIDAWYIYLPLLLMSLITMYIFVERWLTVAKANNEDSNFMNNIKQYINQGKLSDAKNLCVTTNTPVARMIGKGIARIGKPLEDIKGAVENSGKLEISNLEKNTSILAIIASIAPMFGFLGTVIGVITIFHNIANIGKIEIGVVSQGLYIKMISSAAGLVVGMLAYVAYNTLVTRIGRLVNTMESHAVEFVDILDEPMN
jgi:biopolymer transport protein ExbB